MIVICQSKGLFWQEGKILKMINWGFEKIFKFLLNTPIKQQPYLISKKMVFALNSKSKVFCSI
ncbi:MAG TPA: hypothetical protein DCM62_01065 [Bacteroidales bacterium]|nr:hypothetical protein [Bacteroidales bacterium]